MRSKIYKETLFYMIAFEKSLSLFRRTSDVIKRAIRNDGSFEEWHIVTLR